MYIAGEKRQHLGDELIEEIGTVEEALRGRFVVRCDGARFDVKRAVSCLVEPEVGDEVLFAGKPSGDLYVLAVLERTDPTKVVVRVPGDLTLQVDGGRFAVAASEGLDLVSSRHIALTSRDLEVRASRGQVLVKTLSFLGERLFGEVDAVKVVSAKIERIADQLIDRVKRSYRFIEEADNLRAGSVDYIAQDTMRLKGENSFLQAEMLVKVDGDQIHLG